jgi:hypothetical protein
MSTALKLATLLKRVATDTVAGLVKVNGNGLSINSSGVLESTAVTKKLQLHNFTSGNFSANVTFPTRTDVAVSSAAIASGEITAVFLNGSLIKFSEDYTLDNGGEPSITTTIIINSEAVLTSEDNVTVLRMVPI